MILLISVVRDVSTDIVIDWLNYLGGKYQRINKETPLEKTFISINNQYLGFELFSNNEILNSDNIYTFWYRKNGIKFDSKFNPLFKNKKAKNILQFLEDEKVRTKEFIEYILSKKRGIGYYEGLNLNKLKVLHLAKECGLLIPETIITTEKAFTKNSGFIIKNISEVLHFTKKRKRYITYTKMINKNQLPNSFNLTLLQNKVEKEYEVRAFYLNEGIYSMAIFSQNDDKTKIDFRKYNFNKPNRYVPYRLPKSIEQNIIKLMNKLELDTGSIDLIVDKKGEYYFLEINPAGQFGMVSIPCNYFLERKIAKTLINYDTEKSLL